MAPERMQPAEIRKGGEQINCLAMRTERRLHYGNDMGATQAYLHGRP